MRHARRIDGETLVSTARIATGGHMFVEIQNEHAPGRTYHQLARRSRLEILKRNARDRSPAMTLPQSKILAPGSPYSNSLARVHVQSKAGSPARGTPKRET